MASTEVPTLDQVTVFEEWMDACEQIDLAYAAEDANLFAEWVLKDRQGNRVIQGEIHRLIQDFLDWCEAHSRHALILAPWGHGKTEQVAIGRTLYMLGRDRNLRIKIVCNTDDAARDRVLSLRRYLEEDEDLRRIYPELRMGGEQRSTSKLTVERDGRGKDASIEAKGILAQSVGARCDRLVCDDIVDLKNAIQEPASREKVKQAFREGYMNRLDSDGLCVYIATVWHLNDLTMESLKAARAGRGMFAALVMKVSDDLERIDVEVVNAGFKAPESIPLWESWPKERLRVRRDEEIGTRSFARGYHQRPISDEDAYFREEWFRVAGRAKTPLTDADPAHYHCYIGVDPAISTKERACEYALAVVGRHKADGVLRLLHRVRVAGLSVQGQAEEIIAAFMKYQPVMTRIESNAYQAALEQVLHERARSRGLSIPCEGVPSTKDKGLYIGSWAALVETGQFEIDADRFPDVVSDALSFPVSDKVDVLDAISRAVGAANAVPPAVSLEAEEVPAWAAAEDRRWGFNMRGRSR